MKFEIKNNLFSHPAAVDLIILKCLIFLLQSIENIEYSTISTTAKYLYIPLHFKIRFPLFSFQCRRGASHSGIPGAPYTAIFISI